jgi:hypothetical protein
MRSRRAEPMKSFRQRLLRVVFEVMRPFARLMLNAGLGYKDFAEVAKLAFVEVALNHYGVRGRATNVSRVSVMTGISRREIPALRIELEKLVADEVPIGLAQPDILHFWLQDPEYLDNNARPKALPYHGDTGSFMSLVRRYGGDIPPGALRSELKRVGAIAETPSGLLELVKTYFVPSSAEERMLLALRQNVRALLTTVAHNSDVNRIGPGRIERCVYTEKLTDEQIETLRASIRISVENFSQEVDSVFAGLESENRVLGVLPSGRTVAVGLYFFED